MIGLVAVVLALTLFAPGFSSAIDAKISGVELTVSYEEPRVNVDRSELKDLQKTTVYWHWKGNPKSVTKAAEVPATRPAGGGAVSVKVTIPVKPQQEREVTIYTTASDHKGNESGRSNEVTLRIDRLPPAPPR